MTKIKASELQGAAIEMKATQKLIRTVIIKPAMGVVTMACNGFVGLVARNIPNRMGDELDVQRRMKE